MATLLKLSVAFRMILGSLAIHSSVQTINKKAEVSLTMSEGESTSKWSTNDSNFKLSRSTNFGLFSLSKSDDKLFSRERQNYRGNRKHFGEEGKPKSCKHLFSSKKAIDKNVRANSIDSSVKTIDSLTELFKNDQFRKFQGTNFIAKTPKSNTKKFNENEEARIDMSNSPLKDRQASMISTHFILAKNSNGKLSHHLRNDNNNFEDFSHATVQSTYPRQHLSVPLYQMKGRILQEVSETSLPGNKFSVEMKKFGTSFNFTIQGYDGSINKLVPESFILSQLDAKQQVSANSSLVQFMVPKNTTYIEVTFDTHNNCLFPIFLLSTNNFTAIRYTNSSNDESFAFDLGPTGSIGFRVNPSLSQITFYPSDLPMEIHSSFSSQMISLSSETNAHPTYGSLYCPLFAEGANQTFTASIRLLKPITKTSYLVDWKMIERTTLPFPVMLTIPAAGESIISMEDVKQPLKFIFSAQNMNVAILFDYFQNNVELRETRDFAIDGMIEMSCPTTPNLTITVQNKNGLADYKMRVLILKGFGSDIQIDQRESPIGFYFIIAGSTALILIAITIFGVWMRNRRKHMRQQRKASGISIQTIPVSPSRLAKQSSETMGLKEKSNAFIKSLSKVKKTNPLEEQKVEMDFTGSESECNSPSKSDIDSELRELKRSKFKLSNFAMKMDFESDLEVVEKPKNK